MNTQEALEDAIRVFALSAGLDRPEFHLTSVSRDSAGVFIMETAWPDGRLICERIARVVSGFPKVPFTACVALLPDMVNEIIQAAQIQTDGARFSRIARDGPNPSQRRQSRDAGRAEGT